MLLGILSDSHGQADRVRAAVSLFENLGVHTIVHCGDVGGTAVFDELVGHRCRFVWGNMDAPEPGLRAYLEAAGLDPPDSVPLKLDLEGKTILVFHGHEPEFQRILADPGVDYILCGHTHVRRDERIGGARVVNPGALHRARRFTAATLDLEHDVVEFYEIEP